MNNQPITRDERTTAVENASYRLAYFVLSFGILMSVAYRSFVLHESSWDLLALIVLGGVIATLYQKAYQVLSRRWMLVTALTVVMAGIIAFALASIR